ncbi:MAG: hypothetical protein JWO46_567 [Nocardioidaceae bacterium]|nr:hypothetical protein [Nocardioidaceae bacterium]
MNRARAFHALTFAVAAFALVLQAVLIVQGKNVLDQAEAPDLATRLVRFVSYLTIWSNALVAWSTFTLATGTDRDTRLWRALRLDAVMVCLGGGIVHFFFLRPILDLHGGSALADHLLHQVVPILATIGFVVFGPRRRIAWSDLGPFLVVPVVWFGYTIVRGAFVDWYPYPFVNVDKHGYAVVLLNGVGVGVFMAALFVAGLLLDRRLSRDV